MNRQRPLVSRGEDGEARHVVHDVDPSAETPQDVPLREATRLYVVELSTLRRLVRLGRVPAYKVRGPWGREWRVPRAALEAHGFARRPADVPAPRDGDRVSSLERELFEARRAVAAERTRADEADRRLGMALLQAGRLRAELVEARGVDPSDDPTRVGLSPVDADELRHVLVDLRSGRLANGR